MTVMTSLHPTFDDEPEPPGTSVCSISCALDAAPPLDAIAGVIKLGATVYRRVGGWSR